MSTYNTHREINGVENVAITVHYDAREGDISADPGDVGYMEIERIDLPDGTQWLPGEETLFWLEEEISDWLCGRYDQDAPEGYE